MSRSLTLALALSLSAVQPERLTTPVLFDTAEADKILDPVKIKAESAGLEFSSVHAISPSPWEAILAAAKKQKCEAIVMASHGRRGVSALLLGSETQKVLTHSKLPVIVVR